MDTDEKRLSSEDGAKAQTILSVDDEPHMLRLLERLITEKTSYSITTTSNSLEVPELLRSNTFDVILADLKMPGLDGIDILRMVREMDRPEEVIIITAFGSLENAVESLSLGVFDYITKPFKKEQIIYTIDRAMRWQQMKKETAWIDALFEIEPFTAAREAVEREYVRRLARRYSGDESAMAEHSGIAGDRIRALLSGSSREEEQ